jgi:hypothetical protein
MGPIRVQPLFRADCFPFRENRSSAQVGKAKRARHFRCVIGDRWWAWRKGAFAHPRITATRYVECTACGASYLCASQDDSIAGTKPTVP